MALVNRKAKPSFDVNTTMYAPQISDRYAGEDLDAAASCYIKAADSKVYMSDGTAANEAARCDGFTVQAHKAGEPVALHGIGTRLGYGDGTLPAGADLYVAATKGRLSDTATVGGTTPVARVIGNTQDIQVRAYK